MNRSWTDKQLIDAVATSKNLSQVSGKLGLRTFGANSSTIKKHILRLGLDTSHFDTKEEILAKARQSKSMSEMSDDDMFCINTVDRGSVKSRIIRDELLPYECAICHITDWTGQPLSLHLDHTNGVNNDNRLENLRFLCPNCHSLTDTYCGKQLRKEKTPLLCPGCSNPMFKTSKQCQSCANKIRKTKIEWPSTQELQAMIEDCGTVSATARKLGVSFNGLKKRLRK